MLLHSRRECGREHTSKTALPGSHIEHRTKQAPRLLHQQLQFGTYRVALTGDEEAERHRRHEERKYKDEYESVVAEDAEHNHGTGTGRGVTARARARAGLLWMSSRRQVRKSYFSQNVEWDKPKKSGTTRGGKRVLYWIDWINVKVAKTGDNWAEDVENDWRVYASFC